jgi:hypothetical protein
LPVEWTIVPLDMTGQRPGHVLDSLLGMVGLQFSGFRFRFSVVDFRF